MESSPSPRPPFFPAFNNSIVAGKKGGRGIGLEMKREDSCI